MSAGDALLLEEEVSIPDYESGIARFISEAKKHEVALAPDVLGFKTVLADGYFGVHKVDPLVLDAMRAWQDVAPAHNGPYLAVMKSLADTWLRSLRSPCLRRIFIARSRSRDGVSARMEEAYGISATVITGRRTASSLKRSAARSTMRRISSPVISAVPARSRRS